MFCFTKPVTHIYTKGKGICLHCQKTMPERAGQLCLACWSHFVLNLNHKQIPAPSAEFIQGLDPV